MNWRILFLLVVISVAIKINAQTACTERQGFYGVPHAMGCYNNTSIASNTQIMLNAFGTDASVVFGNVANRRFFTLFKTDITNNNIIKMLPGAHPGKPIAIDNVLPYDGAYYDDPSTWSLVPIQPTGTSKGTINNLLLAQAITLWFNLRTSSTLGTISLAEDTLITSAQTSCGSNIATGTPSKFGILHSIILYLNGGNGYTNDVNGLFQLANDVLGAANTSVTASSVQQAVTSINLAFEGCRILVGTIPAAITQKKSVEIRSTELPGQNFISIRANPNPSNINFSVTILSSDLIDRVTLTVTDFYGRIIEERIIRANSSLEIGERYSSGVYIVRATQGNLKHQLKLVKMK